MSERKKLKADKNINEARKLYEALKTTTSSPNDTSCRKHVAYLMKTLSIPCVRSYGIMALAELFRISGSASILVSTELVVLFETLCKVIVSEKIDLDTFLALRIPSYMKNKGLILKFFELIQKTKIHNRKYLEQILTIFIEENEDRNRYVSIVLQNSGICKDVIEKIHKYIDVMALEEDEYLRLFCENECIRINKEVRIVKGRKRLQFVQKAIDSHYQAVLENYSKDRDKRVRLVLADKVSVSDERFFPILLNDHDEDVRLAVLKRIRWNSGLLDISERLLDKSYDVRREVARIYKEGLFKLRQLPLFKKELLKIGRLNFDSDDHHELSKDYEVFMKFVHKLFEGCLTVFKEEYIQMIKESNFTLDFLAEHQDHPGIHYLFDTMELGSYSEVPRDLRAFCLEHLYKGSLNNKEIADALEDNIFAVLKFIKDPSVFFDTLLEKAMAVQDLQSVELIVESIKSILSKKPMVKGVANKGHAHSMSSINDTVVDDSGNFAKDVVFDSFEFDSPNLYFINAHTKCDQAFIEHQCGKESYPHLYFIVHQSKEDPRISLCLKNCTLPLDQKIKLLVYLNNPEVIADFSDLLIRHDLEFKLQMILLSRKTLTASLIYFVCTGLVSVKNPSFFIKCIKLTLSCNSPEKVKWVFERYIKAVDQKTFDLFYSICWALKGCATIKTSNGNARAVADGLAHDDSIILNPKISIHDYTRESDCALAVRFSEPMLETTMATVALTSSSENRTNQSTCTKDLQSEKILTAGSVMGQCKLRLSRADKMLHFICNLVIASRKGAFTELNVNFSRYGFFKMSESHVEMLGRGQVLYE